VLLLLLLLVLSVAAAVGKHLRTTEASVQSCKQGAAGECGDIDRYIVMCHV